MYSEAFCRVYNLLGWNYFPEAFGKELLRWLESRGAKPVDCLDLACGTGVLCEVLLYAGMRPMGVDLSRGMIDVARRRCPEIEYAVGDMVTFRPERRFDLVTCTGDALNHVLDPEDVARVFGNALAALSPGGWFVFDLLGEGEIPGEEPFELDFSETIKARFRVTRDGDGFISLRTEVFEDGAFAFEEVIRERLYDPRVICDALRRAGFEVVQCDNRLLPDSAPGATWYIAARRPV